MLALRLAVAVIKVGKPNGSHKYGKRPAHCHCEELGDEHKNGVYEEDIFTHDKANDTFIDEARIRIKKCVDNGENYHVYGHRALAALR